MSWLQEYRKTQNLTQAQTADVLEISRYYYIKIENGQIPSVKVAKKIAKLLKFDWTIFFEKE